MCGIYSKLLRSSTKVISAPCKRFTTLSLDVEKIERECIFCNNGKNFKLWTRENSGLVLVIGQVLQKSLKDSEICMHEFMRECSRNYTWRGEAPPELAKGDEPASSCNKALAWASRELWSWMALRKALLSSSKVCCWVIALPHQLVIGCKLPGGGEIIFVKVTSSRERDSAVNLSKMNTPIIWGNECVDPEFRMQYTSMLNINPQNCV